MESEYGSLTRGMLAAHRKMRAKAPAQKNGIVRPTNAGGSVQPPTPRGIFTTLRGGLQQLIDALVARLNPASVRLVLPVSGLEKVADGWMVTAGFNTEFYDAVIVASPAWAASVLLGKVDAELSEELGAIPYSSSITVNLIYDEKKLGPLPDGFGFLVPASEGRAMLACTFVHRKFLGRTPPQTAILRAFLGGMKNEALLADSDEELVATVRRELAEILGEGVVGLAIEPEHTQVSRWRRSMAQYAVGHQARIERISARVAVLPGLRLVGNAYDGIGIPDCIRLGRKAATDLLAAGELARQQVN
jgi:oxygen-dependent protoporphyrinogen oxidase